MTRYRVVLETVASVEWQGEASSEEEAEQEAYDYAVTEGNPCHACASHFDLGDYTVESVEVE